MILDRTKPRKIVVLMFAAATFLMQHIGSLAKAESAGGLRWASPSEWTHRGSTRMRVATYIIPSIAGDSEDGECVVYFFGPGQGGSVPANLRRWLGQFRTPDGGPVDQLARTDKLRVGEIEVTRLEVNGTYLFKPTPFAPKAVPKPGYRMFAAIAQGPVGPVFFKLTAPDKTARSAKDAFESMLQSLTR
ncbi:MAG: hypothetical protein CMN58_02125 [Solibacterales bacterium]|nr:hypothetical protein [Bryobacterales bacterium]